MDTPSSLPRPGRFLRWGIAAAIAVLLLTVYWVTLDRVATRIGESAESTFRTLPANDDTRHRSD